MHTKYDLKSEINIFAYEITENSKQNLFSIIKSVLSFKGEPFRLKTSAEFKTAFAPNVEDVYNLLITPEKMKLSQPIDLISSISRDTFLRHFFWIFALVASNSTKIQATFYFHCIFSTYPSIKIRDSVTLSKLHNLVHMQSTGIKWYLGVGQNIHLEAGLTPKMFLESTLATSQSVPTGIALPSVSFVMILATANAGLDFTAAKYAPAYVPSLPTCIMVE